jgi:His Kinase A (phospho-acceptor) domain
MTDPGYADLVGLACHDLRTPLATVNGFAKMMIRAGELDEKKLRYLQLIDEGAEQMARLVDQLSLATRIAAGRYDPVLAEADTLELASASGIPATGKGARIETDTAAVTGSLAALATAALRFGDAPAIAWTVEDRELSLAPVGPAAAAVLDGSSAKDLGALVARSAIDALGGAIAVDGQTLRVRL